MKRKYDVLNIFIQFKHLVEKYFTLPIKCFQADWGGEYQALTNYLREHGISQRISYPHTPKQNGCAERKHRHIVEIGRALLTHASIPLHYWTYTFECAVDTLNRLPFN